MNGPELPRLPRPQPAAKPPTRAARPPQSPNTAIVSFFAASRIPGIQPLGSISPPAKPLKAKSLSA